MFASTEPPQQTRSNSTHFFFLFASAHAWATARVCSVAHRSSRNNSTQKTWQKAIWCNYLEWCWIGWWNTYNCKLLRSWQIALWSDLVLFSQFDCGHQRHGRTWGVLVAVSESAHRATLLICFLKIYRISQYHVVNLLNEFFVSVRRHGCAHFNARELALFMLAAAQSGWMQCHRVAGSRARWLIVTMCAWKLMIVT